MELTTDQTYCPQLRTCYLLPFDVIGSRVHVQLRIGPSRNNQSSGINWAKDYEFDATIPRLGAVAQLGERCHGMAEARGSSPLGSIRNPPCEAGFAFL